MDCSALFRGEGFVVGESGQGEAELVVGGTWECLITGGREAEQKVDSLMTSTSHTSSITPSTASTSPSFEDSSHSRISPQTSPRAVAHTAATAVLAAALFPVQNFSIARLSRGSRRRGNWG